ncbi:diaminopimelate epimerase [Streptomyces sp. Termitarium-T10T-6]|nr:diaminopimelate epimerase [Streptomyces sp. Termitarium-T10T-6]
MSTSQIAFLKGHGTENDFVIVPDPDNALTLPAALVARLCDRRAGIGGDGLLHVVRSAAHPEARSMAETAEWFMDYRNADGSIAEMCGNGVRVFAHYLQRAGLVEEGDLTVATRGGPKRVHLAKNGDITVSMGQALLPDAGVTVSVDGRSWPARNVNMGNPHAVAFVDDLDHAGDLFTAPPFTPEAGLPRGRQRRVRRRPGPAPRRHARPRARLRRDPLPAAPEPARSPSPPPAGTAPTPP